MSVYGADLLALLPELIIAVTACLVIALDPITPASRRDLLAWLSVGSLVICLGITIGQINSLNTRVSAFSELVVIDPYARFWKILLCGVAALTILMSRPYLKAERIHLGEYYGFILLALSGMMVMVSGVDLLTIYLGTELMSLSLYVMTGLNRSKLRSLEAAAKYFVLGAFSSGILLYGISLLYGLAGSTKLETIASAIGTRGADDPLVLIATILIAVGFGFKIAAVPFHMWTPDVYQGAPTSVTAFMAVAAKAASFAAFMRVFVEGLGGLKADWSLLFLLISVVTLVLGNVVAIVQTNIKRMLAYSSIAHAGYALIGFVAAGRGVGLFGGTPGLASIMIYLAIYSFITLGAFAVIGMLRKGGIEGRDRGLHRARKAPTTRGLSHADFHDFTGGYSTDCRFYGKILRVYGSSRSRLGLVGRYCPGLCRRIGLLLYEGGHGDVYAGPESFLRCAAAPRDLTDPVLRFGLRSRGRDPVRPLSQPSRQLCAPIGPDSQIVLWQDAEKARQRRSRIAQILNVPQRVRLRSSLAAALLDSLFEHPAGPISFV